MYYRSAALTAGHVNTGRGIWCTSRGL